MIGYLIPIAALIILIVRSWDWFLVPETRRISSRGWVLLISGVLAFALAVNQYKSDVEASQKLLRAIELEGRRLSPGDFQVELEISAHASALFGTPNYKPPESLKLQVVIDRKLIIRGRYVLRAEVARDSPPGRSPNRYWHYHGTDLFVDGLTELRYKDDLYGKVIRQWIPRNALGPPFRRKVTGITSRIFIKGEEFSQDYDSLESGVLEIQIPEVKKTDSL